MDQQFDFRALLIKLQDCLSDNDRRRLHFIVGDTIPRQLRDDPTLGGTLSLLESLVDQAKISEQDFDYLIHAFNEIHCYEAVKRLKQHQLAQHLRDRSDTTSTNVSELYDDNQEDKMCRIKIIPDVVSSNTPKQRESSSSQATTTSFDQPHTTDDKLTLTKTSLSDKNKNFMVDLTFVKQKLKSRLTICQLILLLLNIVGIIIFIVLIILFTRSKHSISDILLIKTGTFYGNTGGGNGFNDAQDCSLTFTDKITSITAGWTSDVLDYVTFSYSNGKSEQHGRQTYRYSPYTSEFDLDPDENINGVTVYTGTRMIVNPFAPNGSFLVIGLRFNTTKGRNSDLFGSSNGTEIDETFPTFTVAYVRGNALGYLDAIQFIWYRQPSRSNVAYLSTY